MAHGEREMVVNHVTVQYYLLDYRFRDKVEAVNGFVVDSTRLEL